MKKIPVTIITGFLGSGKTTSILQLLKNKPADERWAVLVNEFGEIGIDGAFFESKHTQEQGVYIRQVPGGCMCCTAGISMRKALDGLVKQANPDRVVIEPTGLGHPIEILQTLKNKYYKDIFSVQNVIAIVDAAPITKPDVIKMIGCDGFVNFCKSFCGQSR